MKERVFKSSTRGKPRGKPYTKGSPPGPGRPKGCCNKVSADLRSLFETHATGVLGAAILKARKGDIAALKLFFRLIESYINRIEVALPEIRGIPDIPVFQAAVLKAIQRGKISPENATVLFDLSDRVREAFESELAARVFGNQPFTVPDPPDVSNPDPSDADSEDDGDSDTEESVEDEANAQ